MRENWNYPLASTCKPLFRIPTHTARIFSLKTFSSWEWQSYPCLVFPREHTPRSPQLHTWSQSKCHPKWWNSLSSSLCSLFWHHCVSNCFVKKDVLRDDLCQSALNSTEPSQLMVTMLETALTQVGACRNPDSTVTYSKSSFLTTLPTSSQTKRTFHSLTLCLLFSFHLCFSQVNIYDFITWCLSEHGQLTALTWHSEKDWRALGTQAYLTLEGKSERETQCYAISSLFVA